MLNRVVFNSGWPTTWKRMQPISSREQHEEGDSPEINHGRINLLTQVLLQFLLWPEALELDRDHFKSRALSRCRESSASTARKTNERTLY